MNKYHLPHIDKKVDTVILANGSFPTHPIPLSILNNCKYLVCCDGATNNLLRTTKVPDAIVGDCDSLSADNQQQFANIIHRKSEQETNDLTKSVTFCLEQGRNNITILGATGKREDHSIANISLLCEYMKEANVEMITDYGIIIGIDTASKFESYSKQQVSIFCIDSKPISSSNLSYPLNNSIFTNWWQASLNESTDDEFIIEANGRTIVYRAY